MRYLTCAETAKLIRAALKREFPGIPFSVRSKTYSGGASITVGWTDGPGTPAVDRILKTFEGKQFDGMIDLAVGVECYLDSDGNVTGSRSRGTEGSKGCIPSHDDAPPMGEPVHFGADYVFSAHRLSPQTERANQEKVCKRFGLDPSIIGTKEWDFGRVGNDSLHTWAWRETSGYYDQEA